MNSRGYQFFTGPAPGGGVPNPFLSFVPPPARPPPFHPYSPNPYTFGFPSMPMPQDIDPSRHPIPPPLQHPPPGNEIVHNFFQQASFVSPQPPPIPLTVRSGVYDLRAIKDMANSLKERSSNIDSSPQPLAVQPPPRGHFTSTQNDPQSPPSTNGSDTGVVNDDPTTYWLGIDTGTNEFAQNTNPAPPPSRSRRNKHNNNTNNNNNNNNSNDNNTSPNNTNVTTSPTTSRSSLASDTTDSPTVDANGEKSEESITVSGATSTNGTRHTKKGGYPFSGPSTSTTTSDFPRNNNRNRQMHTSRNSTKRVSEKI